MPLKGRGSGAVAVVPQHGAAVVALHKPHSVVRAGLHDARKPSPHTTDSAQAHFVVAGRDQTPLREMLQHASFGGVSVS